MSTLFYSGREVWRQIAIRIRNGKRVRAAIAYVGRGASEHLPLRSGDVLLVDMSLQAVRQGVTDPREVAKFIRAGVQVFSRRSLHAKYILVDRTLFVGSANASRNSAMFLDEAALMTTDRATLLLASQCFGSWCTEPVRKRYLDECIAEYRPPRFKAARDIARPIPSHTAEPVRLWLIGGLRYFDVPKNEEKLAAAAEERAKSKLGHGGRTEIDQLHYPRRLDLMKTMKPGDWAVTCIRSSRGRDVLPPQQLISIESYSRGDGKKRWVMQFEAARDRDEVGLRRFQRALRTAVGETVWDGRRTKAVRKSQLADAILRLWTQRGKPSRRMSEGPR